LRNHSKIPHRPPKNVEARKKNNSGPGISRILSALLIFILLTLNANIVSWINQPLNSEIGFHYIILMFKAPMFFIFVPLFYILAIFNAGFNLVMSGKPGSIGLVHFVLIGIVTAFSIFAHSSMYSARQNCLRENFAIICWVQNIFD
jgi:hypothetical protein